MTVFIALFRAINVGGNRLVKMEALRALHESLGLRGVRSYIQSGNVVFSSDETDTTRLQKQLEGAFEERFGFHSDVLLRTSAELLEIIQNNPFGNQPDKKREFTVVMFLAKAPDGIAPYALLKQHSGPEEVFIIGKQAYIYYTYGQGRSTLTGNVLEKKLNTVGTARNWNTILQLYDMTQRA